MNNESLFESNELERLTINGIRKIVMFKNKSHYSSEVVIDGVVQVVGVNGAGKTTLLNSVPFLYDVNAISRTGTYSVQNTTEHYFPDNDSILLFEIDTPEDGIVVIGLKGSARPDNNGNKFQRFIYREEYNCNDYIDCFLSDGTPKIKSAFNLDKMLESKPSFLNIKGNDDYYNLISGTNKEFKSLNLVPSRDSNGSKVNYKNFIKIFRNINKIADEPSQDEIKDMIIGASLDNAYGTKDKALDNYRKDIEGIDFKEAKIKYEKNKNKDMLILKDDISKITSLIKDIEDSSSNNEEEFKVYIAQLKDSIDNMVKRKDEIVIKQKSFSSLIKETSEKNIQLETRKKDIVSFVKEYELTKRKIDSCESGIQYLETALFNVSEKIKKIELTKRTSINYNSLSNDDLIKNINRKKKENDLNESLIDRIPYINTFLSKEYSVDETNKIFFFLNIGGVFHHIENVNIDSKKDLKDFFNLILESYNNKENVFSGFGLSIKINQKDIDAMSKSRNAKELRQDIEENNIEIKRIESELYLRNNNEKINSEILSLKEKEKETSVMVNAHNFVSDNCNDYNKKISELKDVELLIKGVIEKAEKDQADFMRASYILSDIEKSISEYRVAVEYFEKCVSMSKNKFNNFMDSFYRTDNKIVLENKSLSSIISSTNNKLKSIRTLTATIDATIKTIDIEDINNYNGYENLRINLEGRLESFNKSVSVFQTSKKKALDSFGTYIDCLFSDIDKLGVPIKEINGYFNKNKGSNLSNIHSVKFKIDFDKNLFYHELKDYKTVKDNDSNKADYHDDLYRRLRLILTKKQELAFIDIKELFSLKIIVSKDGSKPIEYTSFDSAGSNGTTISMKLLFYVFLLRKSHKKSGGKFYMLFFIDEAGSLDPSNFDKIASVANDLNMKPIIASPTPLTPETSKITCYYPKTVRMQNGEKRLLIKPNNCEILINKKD